MDTRKIDLPSGEDFASLISRLCVIRGLVDELAGDFRHLWEQPEGPDIAGELHDALEEISGELAELEGEPEELPATNSAFPGNITSGGFDA